MSAGSVKRRKIRTEGEEGVHVVRSIHRVVGGVVDTLVGVVDQGRLNPALEEDQVEDHN